MNIEDLDLSRLPEGEREQWRQRLAQVPPGIRDTLLKNVGSLPPDKLAALLQRSAPMLDRMAAKARATAPSSGTLATKASHRPVPQRQAPSGLYNQTVQRGDGGLPLLPLLMVVVIVSSGLYLLLGP